MSTSKQKGEWGETLAARFLEKKGYRLLTRNYRSRYGEIDLILEDREFLVFAEVKLRKSDRFAEAAEFVDHKKQERIRITAEFWLQEHETDLQPRFDVIEIYAPFGMETEHPKIRHLEEAF